jgi:peptidoglycan/xylan/chitin deacetylase (PgdA/CDA1 family)
MSLTKNISRKIVFPCLLSLGFEKLLLSFKSKKNIIINFHGVTNIKGNRFNNRHMDASEFEKIIIYLKKNYNIVPLKELFEIYRSKKTNGKRTIALTFDDGYINNFTVALPILKKHQVPATFYLISEGLVNKDFYVWPDVIDLIQKNTKEDLVFSFGTFKFPNFYSDELQISLVDLMKKSAEKRETYLNEIKTKYPIYLKEAAKFPKLIKLITKEEIASYKNEPLIEYGSHTHLHYNLEHLTEATCSDEVNRSKTIIEESIGKPIISLAFPDGSYNTTTIANCKKAGYENVTAVSYKLNENNKDPYILSRFTISNSTTCESNILRLVMQYDQFGF